MSGLSSGTQLESGRIGHAPLPQLPWVSHGLHGPCYFCPMVQGVCWRERDSQEPLGPWQAAKTGSEEPVGQASGHSASAKLLQSRLTLCDPVDHSLLLRPRDSPGKNTGVGCHYLLHRIFLTQGSNMRLLRLLHWQADSLQLSPLGSQVAVIEVIKRKREGEEEEYRPE